MLYLRFKFIFLEEDTSNPDFENVAPETDQRTCVLISQSLGLETTSRSLRRGSKIPPHRNDHFTIFRLGTMEIGSKVDAKNKGGV